MGPSATTASSRRARGGRRRRACACAKSRLSGGCTFQFMKLIADDVYLLPGFPPNAINVYLVGDVLVDAATRHAGRRILRQIEGREVTAHALTHAHADHQGASHEICEK